MRAVQTAPDYDVDLRDALYRVRFSEVPAQANFAITIDEWDLMEVDGVVTVLDWANERANDRDFEVFVRVDESLSWIRIYGSSPERLETVIEVLLSGE